MKKTNGNRSALAARTAAGRDGAEEACVWRRELVAYLQDELAATDRTRLEAHLISCAGCAAQLAAFRGLLETMTPSAGEAPAADLTPAILARLAEDDARTAAQRSWNALLFRAAAVLIGLLAIGSWCWRGSAGRAPGSMARRPADHPGLETPAAARPPLPSAAHPPDEVAAIRQALAWL